MMTARVRTGGRGNFVVLASVAFALVAALAGLLAWWQGSRADQLEALARDGVVAEATVQSLECGQRGTVVYTLPTAKGDAIVRGKSCEGACIRNRVGAKVALRYLPSDPMINRCGSWRPADERSLGEFTLPLFIAAVLLALVLYPGQRMLNRAAKARAKPDGA